MTESGDRTWIDNYRDRWESVELENEISIRQPPEDRVGIYASYFPSEIRRGIEGIDGDLQFATTYLLIENGRMSFSELKEELDVHQQTLSNALSKMQKGSLITQIDVQSIDERYNSFYEVTSFGYSFVDSLFESLGSGDGEIEFADSFIEDPLIDGMLFSSYSNVERYGAGGERVNIVQPEVLYDAI